MKRIIISVGNPLKSDDNVSNLILEKLQERIKDDSYYFLKATTSPENFIEPLKKLNPDVIYFIDAAIFPGNVGDIKLFQLKDILHFNISTHHLPITVFKEFFPESNIMLIGIRPKSLDVGEELTLELKNKLDEITKKVRTIVEYNL
jgi:hydrogenase 3 maturation protease